MRSGTASATLDPWRCSLSGLHMTTPRPYYIDTLLQKQRENFLSKRIRQIKRPAEMTQKDDTRSNVQSSPSITCLDGALQSRLPLKPAHSAFLYSQLVCL